MKRSDSVMENHLQCSVRTFVYGTCIVDPRRQFTGLVQPALYFKYWKFLCSRIASLVNFRGELSAK